MGLSLHLRILKSRLARRRKKKVMVIEMNEYKEKINVSEKIEKK